MEFSDRGTNMSQSDFRLPRWENIGNDFSEATKGEFTESQAINDPELNFQQAFASRGALEVDGNRVVKLVEPEQAAEYREYLGNVRRELIERFPSETNGLDMDWTERYVEDLGLHVTPAIVLPEEAKADWNSEVAAYGDNPRPIQINGMGGHYPALDLAVVFRNAAQEEICGPEHTEAVVLHERMHGTDVPACIGVNAVSGAVDVRGSYIIDGNSNNFLEEGFSEMHAVKGLMGRDYIKRLWEPEDPTVSVSVNSENVRIVLPSKYVYRMPDGEADFPTAAYPAAALEALIEVDPEIGSALIESRKDRTKFLDVTDKVNAIDPDMMNNLSYNTPASSLQYVLKRLDKQN